MKDLITSIQIIQSIQNTIFSINEDIKGFKGGTGELVELALIIYLKTQVIIELIDLLNDITSKYKVKETKLLPLGRG